MKWNHWLNGKLRKLEWKTYFVLILVFSARPFYQAYLSGKEPPLLKEENQFRAL